MDAAAEAEAALDPPVPLPQLLSSPLIRASRTNAYIRTLLARVGRRGRTLEERIINHRCILAAAFRGARGCPDGRLWVVAKGPVHSKREQQKISMHHPDVAGGKVFLELVKCGRAVAELVYAASSAGALIASAPPPSPAVHTPPLPLPPPLPVIAPEVDGPRVRDQVRELFAQGGVLHTFARMCDSLAMKGAEVEEEAEAGGSEADDGAAVATPFADAVEQRQREVAQESCTAVLAGHTGAGKSTFINQALYLTEVNGSTYRSKEHHAGEPRVMVSGRPQPLKLEAVETISSLLAAAGVPPADVERELHSRLNVQYPRSGPDDRELEALENASSATFLSRVAKPIEEHVFDGKLLPQDWSFIHSAGSPDGVTTRISTVDHWVRAIVFLGFFSRSAALTLRPVAGRALPCLWRDALRERAPRRAVLVLPGRAQVP